MAQDNAGMLKSDHPLYPYNDAPAGAPPDDGREAKRACVSGSASASGGEGLEAAEAPGAAAADDDQPASFTDCYAPPVTCSTNAHRPSQNASHLDALHYSKMMKYLSGPMNVKDRQVFMEVTQGGGGKGDHP